VTDYYAFRTLSVELHGCSVIVVGKPGVWSWDRLDPGTAALLELVEVGPGDRMLDLGCGTGVAGALAGALASQGHMTLVDCNVAAVTCAERTLAANNLANAEVRLVDGVSGLSPASFDLVLSHLPRGRAVQEELIRGAAWALRPGGRFCFVAHKQAGIKGAIAHAREFLGQCGAVRQKKGYRVALAIRPDDLELPPPADGYISHAITLDDIETTLISKPGVFAWNRLDAGTEALVTAMQIGVGDRVLDLGFGTGLAGLVAARRAPEGQVVLVDADVRAVESARRTLEANGAVNAEVSLSDCGSAILTAGSGQFDRVVTNPPFHQSVGVDYDVACQFVRDAAQVLRPGGRLFLVANRFLRYGDLIRESFGNVDTAYADNRYHIMMAVARKSGSG
jgi:16S rRNA (guanine1207-N2)-methyltransferase